MRECSVSLVIKETQMKTTLIFHFTPVKMTFINETIITTTNVGKDMGKREPYTLLVEM
jgi:hypothetical protein